MMLICRTTVFISSQEEHAPLAAMLSVWISLTLLLPTEIYQQVTAIFFLIIASARFHKLLYANTFLKSPSSSQPDGMCVCVCHFTDYWVFTPRYKAKSCSEGRSNNEPLQGRYCIISLQYQNWQNSFFPITIYLFQPHSVDTAFLLQLPLKNEVNNIVMTVLTEISQTIGLIATKLFYVIES